MLGRSLVLALAALATAAPALAADTETHSGTLTAIDPARHTLTLTEMGPWTGPGTGLRTRSIVLTPATKVALVQRSQGTGSGGWPGGYVDSPLTPAELHSGEVATVKVTRRGRQLTAVSIEVIRAPNS